MLCAIGCVRLGPDYERPDIGLKPPDSYHESDFKEKGLPVPEDRWWQGFGDPEIDRLVEAVLKNNPDIQRAAARILEVRSRFKEAGADRYPSVNLQAEYRKQHQSITNPFTGSVESETADLWSLSLPASFELDLWGRLARAEEAARAELLIAGENRRTIAQSLIAEAVTLYFQMEMLERTIWINRQSIQTYQESLNLVEGRYRRGLTSVLDVHQARRRLAQAEAALPSLTQDLGKVQQQLAILQGRYPRTGQARSHEADYYRNLSPVPPGLPSDLLARRPDILAAEARLRQLNEMVGVAKANRFPRITLTGGFGYASGELDSLFKPESELWNIAAGGLFPVFNAGKLAAQQVGAEARYQQGVADYAKTVLAAFSEVEGSLFVRKQQLEKRLRVVNFLEQARATQEVAQQRYERGLTDYLTVLESQQTRFSAEENLVLVDFSIFSNRVTLHRALGGGWGNPEQPDNGETSDHKTDQIE